MEGLRTREFSVVVFWLSVNSRMSNLRLQLLDLSTALRTKFHFTWRHSFVEEKYSPLIQHPMSTDAETSTAAVLTSTAAPPPPTTAAATTATPAVVVTPAPPGATTTTASTTPVSPTVAVNTTRAPAAPPPDATESEFLVIALITTMILLLVFGSLIFICKRTVHHLSGAEKRRRALERKTEGEAMERKVWALVDSERDRELAELAHNKHGVDGLDDAGGAAGPNNDDGGADDDEDDVGYADFSHCLTVPIATHELVAPDVARGAERTMEGVEAKRRQRLPSHVPLSGRVLSPIDQLNHSIARDEAARRFFQQQGDEDDDERHHHHHATLAAMSLEGTMSSGFRRRNDDVFSMSGVSVFHSPSRPVQRPSQLPWLAGGRSAAQHAARTGNAPTAAAAGDGGHWADGLDLWATTDSSGASHIVPPQHGSTASSGNTRPPPINAAANDAVPSGASPQRAPHLNRSTYSFIGRHPTGASGQPPRRDPFSTL